MDWSTPFEPSMLLSDDGVIVWCETIDAAESLFEILADARVMAGSRTASGRKDRFAAIAFDSYGDNVCFRVSKDQSGQYRRVTYGSKPYYESEWSSSCHTFCTFLTVEEEVFDVATDDEIKDLFS